MMASAIRLMVATADKRVVLVFTAATSYTYLLIINKPLSGELMAQRGSMNLWLFACMGLVNQIE